MHPNRVSETVIDGKYRIGRIGDLCEKLMAFTHQLDSYFQQEIHKSIDTTVRRSGGTKTTGWDGGWHMVICFGIQLQLQHN